MTTDIAYIVVLKDGYVKSATRKNGNLRMSFTRYRAEAGRFIEVEAGRIAVLLRGKVEPYTRLSPSDVVEESVNATLRKPKRRIRLED